MRLTRLIPAALAATALLAGACEQQDAVATAPVEAAEAGLPACERASDPAGMAAAMAEAEARAVATAKASRGAGQPAIWTLKDEDTTLYLLGTVHLLRPDLQWRSAEIDAAIAAADTVVLEVDTTSPEAGREMMKFVGAKGMFTDGTQLTNLLTAEEAEELAVALKSLDLPIEAVQPMRPWYAAMNISVMQLMRDGFNPEAGVETAIEAEAKAHGAAFGYLETVDQQLGEFAGLDNCAQIEFLMATANALNQGTEMLDLLVSEWVDGDAAGLGALLASPEAFGSEEAYAALLTNRNARWTPLVSGMLDEPGTRLIAVGAGHLVGEDSVIAMLRAEGYEVTGP